MECCFLFIDLALLTISNSLSLYNDLPVLADFTNDLYTIIQIHREIIDRASKFYSTCKTFFVYLRETIFDILSLRLIFETCIPNIKQFKQKCNYCITFFVYLCNKIPMSILQ